MEPGRLQKFSSEQHVISKRTEDTSIIRLLKRVENKSTLKGNEVGPMKKISMRWEESGGVSLTV
jgi:hypothetical protein